MKNITRLIENWIYGLFGYEEQTFMVARNLTRDLLDNGFTGFKSEVTNYPDGESYRLELKIEKISHDGVKVKSKCNYKDPCMFKDE